METIRLITAADDAALAGIIRTNLEKYHLDIPGTAYFDPELEHLSAYYNAFPAKRVYYVMTDQGGRLLGGVGIAEYDGIENCAELQKLYLTDRAKGRGLGRRLMEEAEKAALQKGYRRLYLETHTNLREAILLYEKTGFRRIEKPAGVLHTTMNLFFYREIASAEHLMQDSVR